MRALSRAWISLAAFGLLAAPVVSAHAETDGRIGITNVYSQVTGPDAAFDAALLRVWLRSERIGGRNIALIVDARSDIPILAAPADKFELNNTTIFNDECRGDATADKHPDCRDVPYRESRIGQLLHQAGIFDAFLRFGDIGAGKNAISVGRRTIYEAGLATVDGVTFERGLDRSRFGVFAGAAPDPLTRMFSADYQTGGGYYAFQAEKLWVRVGTVAQMYKFEADRVTVHNHNFLGISRSLRLATLLQFDVIPDAQERLVQADLTYRPSGQYRFRASITRYRPWNFAVSESHIIQPPEDGLIDDFRDATNAPGSSIRGKVDFKQPEVLEDELRTSAINQAKLVAHYTTARSLTPFLSLAFRTREIDGATGIGAGGGIYAYDLYDTGIIGRLRFDHIIGFDYDTDRLGVTAERRMTDSFAFGGSLEYGLVSYRPEDNGLHDSYPESSSFYGVSVLVRSDKMSGISYFAQADYLAESRKMPAQNATSLEPDKDSTTIMATLGVSYRF